MYCAGCERRLTQCVSYDLGVVASAALTLGSMTLSASLNFFSFWSSHRNFFHRLKIGYWNHWHSEQPDLDQIEISGISLKAFKSILLLVLEKVVLRYSGVFLSRACVEQAG